MGITIHYRGRLRDPATLSALMLELQQAVLRLSWPCRVIMGKVLKEHPLIWRQDWGISAEEN